MSPAGAGEEREPTHAWVYESIVEAVPGVRVSTRVALAAQFLGFEAAILVLAWVYDLPVEGVVAGTVAVGVASAAGVSVAASSSAASVESATGVADWPSFSLEQPASRPAPASTLPYRRYARRVGSPPLSESSAMVLGAPK